MLLHGHLEKLAAEKGDSKGELSTGAGTPPNNQLVTSTRAGLDTADAALGYLHPTLRQPAALEPNLQGYCQIKARCRADGKKYGDGGGLALERPAAALFALPAPGVLLFGLK